MGHAVLATKWQKIYRRSVADKHEKITIDVNESLDSPRRLAPWNSAFVMPGRLNSTFTSIMTQAYSKTKRLTTVIDNKGQKHQLHHSVPRDSSDKEFKLPPVFYPKRKPMRAPIGITRTILVPEQKLEVENEVQETETEVQKTGKEVQETLKEHEQTKCVKTESEAPVPAKVERAEIAAN